MSLTVGQKLWFVNGQWRHRTSGEEITVTKVGRKWAETDLGYKIHVDEMYADGGKYTSPGSAYLSEKHYIDEKALGDSWDALRHKIERIYEPPKGMTIAKIEQLTRMIADESTPASSKQAHSLPQPNKTEQPPSAGQPEQT